MFPITISAPLLEPNRPLLHFTAPKGWLNDPNGLVYSQGIYHLFYQHNPFGTQWGNMTWGHATSRDLIHWDHLPLAVKPDEKGTCFSGSAVIDKANTAGFGANAMVGFYTAAGGTNEESKGKPFTQCLFWSTDGTSFTKLGQNPILSHIAEENRDPKVVWFEPTKSWIMALYLSGDQYGFFGSKNLKSWQELSRFNLRGSSECPDLFELPVNGNEKESKWVFWGANGFYQVGNFDGTRFNPETDVLHAYNGNTAYAAQTFSNLPKGKCVQISWFRNSEFPGEVWNQQMGFPNQLRLVKTSSGIRLNQMPVDELKSVRGARIEPKDGNFESASGVFDCEGTWEIPANGKLEFEVNGAQVQFDAAQRTLSALGSTVFVDAPTKKLYLRIVADKASIEIYVQNGLVYMPFFHLLKPEHFKGLKFSNGRNWKNSVKVFEVKM